MKRAILVLLMFSGFVHAIAQQKGTVRFFIDPGHNFEYVLDGKKRLAEKNLELTTGQHKFSFWAPTRAIVDTIIDVQEGAQSFYLRLPHSLSYLTYERQSEKHRKEVFWKRNAPAILTLGTAGWTIASFLSYRKAGKDLNATNDTYALETVPNEIRILKDEAIPAAKDNFKKKTRSFQVAGGVFLLSAAYTAYMWKKTSKLTVPVFEDKAKMEFDGLVYLPDGNGNGMVHAGISLSW